ncbi:MAG: hypothetical protein LUI85_09445 [Bacteroides sp.]|nr:hypothetical protein [Bacteroides sp.]
MKKLIYLLILLACIINIHVSAAQSQQRIFLIEDYTGGTVVLKNKTHVPTDLNYDAANQNMMYMDGDKEMILDQTQGVNTVYIGRQKFIPNGQHGFLEMIGLKNGTIFINWKLKKLLVGKKGAYGQVIQGNVEAMDVNVIKQQAGIARREDNVVDVYTQLNENEYYLLRNGKFVKCRNEKSLLKLFPGKEELIKKYISKHQSSFNNTHSIIELLDYCMGITN